MLPELVLTLSRDPVVVVLAAGLRWLDCDVVTPVLPPAGREADTEPLDVLFCIEAPVLRPLVLLFLMAGVVLTTDDLAADDDVDVTVLPADGLPAACTRLTVAFPAVLPLRLTVLLLPMPPLSEELLL